MIDLTRRYLIAGMLGLLAGAPAYADTYDIGLLEGGTGTGDGQFSFTVSGPGTFPITPTALKTNTNSAIATQCKSPASPPCTYDFLTNSSLQVVVSTVDFTDNKNPPGTACKSVACPNHITGNYVEGLTGSADSPHELQNRFVNCNASGSGQKECFYRIKFAFTAGGPNSDPGTWTRTFTIERWMTVSGVDTLDAVVVSNGTYFVRNTLNSAPEPGSLALVVLGLAALALGGSTFARGARRRAG